MGKLISDWTNKEAEWGFLRFDFLTDILVATTIEDLLGRYEESLKHFGMKTNINPHEHEQKHNSELYVICSHELASYISQLTDSHNNLSQIKESDTSLLAEANFYQKYIWPQMVNEDSKKRLYGSYLAFCLATWGKKPNLLLMKKRLGIAENFPTLRNLKVSKDVLVFVKCLIDIVFTHSKMAYYLPLESDETLHQHNTQTHERAHV